MGVADTGDPAAPQLGICWPPWTTCSCTLTSEAASPSPAPRSRTMLGVGETVTVRVSQGPASWVVTGAGTLDTPSDTWAKVVAGEQSGTFTVTATVSTYSCSLEFSVYQPIAHMSQLGAVFFSGSVEGVS
jgi:hypothetical protein